MQRARADQAEVDLRADRDEEQAEQQALERLDVGLELVAVLAVGEHHAGEERAERRATGRRCCISSAMPTTISSAAAVNDSRSLRPREELEQRPHHEAAARRRRRPRRARAAPTATPGGRRLGRAVGDAARRPRSPSSGNIARIGITAMSWNSSTEKLAWPPCGLEQAALGERLQHDRGRRHRERSGRPRSPASTRTPSAMAAPRDHARRWPRPAAPPSPRIGRRSCHSSAGRSSSPTRNSIITTPNSAKCMTSWPSSPTRPSTHGPIDDAGDQVAEHRAEAEPLRDRHEHDGRGEVDERLARGRCRSCDLPRREHAVELVGEVLRARAARSRSIRSSRSASSSRR